MRVYSLSLSIWRKMEESLPKKDQKDLKRKKKKRSSEESIQNSDIPNDAQEVLQEEEAIPAKKKRKVKVKDDDKQEQSDHEEPTTNSTEENHKETIADLFELPSLGGDSGDVEDEEIVKHVPEWMKDKQNVDHDISHAVSVKKYKRMLSDTLIDNLKNTGIKSFFPVQIQMIPAILKLSKCSIYSSDICVCTPTGSGKTLAYAIPVVESLITRVLCRLRALILVPSRDLVMQVRDTFLPLCKNTDIKVGAITGQTSFKNQQEDLVGIDKSQSFYSKVDILISTPGRLIDHLQETPGFTLQHLKFLIIDEADRLLQQSYQDWLSKVFDAIHTPKNVGIYEENEEGCRIVPATTRKMTPWRYSPTEEPLHKLLFSATLTQNPKKLASLKLNNPQFFASAKEVNFRMPETLKQYMVECSASEKPLVLVHMLKERKTESSLCFTASVEATHRLYLLLKIFNLEVAEYSRTLTQQQRNQIVHDFKQGKIKLIVCSDVMARGMDLEDVQNVFSYDVPFYIKTYIHRCGRTARAGKIGHSFTFVKKEEARHFKDILNKVENGRNIKKKKIHKVELEPYMGQYEEALVTLKNTLEQERRKLPLADKNKEQNHVLQNGIG